MVKKNYIVLIVMLITGLLQPVNGDVTDFKKIVEDYISVNTIKATITQHIYAEDGSAEVFTGNYFAASKGFIRIDYIHPEIQTVVVNDSGLFWYYNDRRILFRSQKKENNDGSIPIMMNVIPQDLLKNIDVISEGMIFYSFFKRAEVYSITSKNSKVKLILWIDPVSKTIRRKYLLDESGREIVKEEYTEHALINGIYIPSRIEFKARTYGGIVHTVTEYSGIVVNGRLDNNIFKFKITPEMEVRILGDKR